MERPIKGWWFAPANGVLGYGDGRKPVEGETHTVDGEPELCAHGLHASRNLLDALQYAQSSVVWRVELSGSVVHGDDKSAATRRKYLQRMDIESILFQFARREALRVAPLWGAPEVVLQYLRTGDESLRDAARDAAWDAARAAAWAAASAAAWAAASAAAWDAAWAAARDAARDAYRKDQNKRLTAAVVKAMKKEEEV